MKIRPYYLIALMGVLLFSGTLAANTIASEQIPEQIQDLRTEIGTDPMSEEEKKLVKEERYHEHPKAAIAADASEDEEKITNGMIYFTSHPGAFHNPLIVFNGGELVEIEDGSRWYVAPEDRYKTLNWYTSDAVVITPNYSWFSLYDYQMINQNTGATIRVNLNIGPFHNGIFTHWVIGFDDILGLVYLEDGSVWNVSPYDDNITKLWLHEDRVIIGVNTGWDSDIRPNILINVRKLNYIRANCLN